MINMIQKNNTFSTLLHKWRFVIVLAISMPVCTVTSGQTVKENRTEVITIVGDDVQTGAEDAIEWVDMPVDTVIVENEDNTAGDFFVDLGLSVLWGTCNIGAESPQPLAVMPLNSSAGLNWSVLPAQNIPGGTWRN